MLLNADYTMVYADGLNRFYLAGEHSELEEAFRYPPNVFDEFVLATHVAEVQRQTNEIGRLHEVIRTTLARCEHLEELDRINAEKLRRINKSLAWRLIKPVVFLRYPDYRAKLKTKLAKTFGLSETS